MQRREFLTWSGATVASALASHMSGGRAAADDAPAPPLRVDPTPRHGLSPWLYTHFMEPLGITDSSIEASWDHTKDCWRPDLVELTKELAPGMMRWGGLFSAYYRWREGVGP